MTRWRAMMMEMVAVVVALQLSSWSTAETNQHRDTLSTASRSRILLSSRSGASSTNEPDDDEYLRLVLNIEIGESSIIADERLGFVDEPHSSHREWYAWRVAIAIIAIVR